MSLVPLTQAVVPYEGKEDGKQTDNQDDALNDLDAEEVGKVVVAL